MRFPTTCMKAALPALVIWTCQASDVFAEPQSVIKLNLGYSSAYEFSESWGIKSKGVGELLFEHPLSSHVFLSHSVGVAHYSDLISNSISDHWNVAVTTVPLGTGFVIKTTPGRSSTWYAQQSVLLLYYDWHSEHLSGIGDYRFPPVEHRDELLLGMKLGGGVEQRFGGRGFVDAGIDYVISEDLDANAFGYLFIGSSQQGLRQFQPHLGVGWSW